MKAQYFFILQVFLVWKFALAQDQETNVIQHVKYNGGGITSPLIFPEVKVCSEDGSICYNLKVQLTVKRNFIRNNIEELIVPKTVFRFHNFTYSDCDGFRNNLLNFSRFAVKNDEFTVPGVLALEGWIQPLLDLNYPFQQSTIVQGPRFLMSSAKNCSAANGTELGFCPFKDVCYLLSMQDYCRDTGTMRNSNFGFPLLPCGCPLKKDQWYSLSHSTYTFGDKYIEEMYVGEGLYYAEMVLSSNGQLGCLNISFNITHIH